MTSVTKPIAASTSPVTTSRSGSSARQVSSQYGAVSELYAQTGVRGEQDRNNFDDFNQQQGRQHSHEQPHTLKLHGTSRTFAMLFEEANTDQNSVSADEYFDDSGYGTKSRPAFSAYMDLATSTYERSTRAINGELRNRGKSLNMAM